MAMFEDKCLFDFLLSLRLIECFNLLFRLLKEIGEYLINGKIEILAAII